MGQGVCISTKFQGAAGLALGADFENYCPKGFQSWKWWDCVDSAQKWCRGGGEEWLLPELGPETTVLLIRISQHLWKVAATLSPCPSPKRCWNQSMGDLGCRHNWIAPPSRLSWFLSLSSHPTSCCKQGFWAYTWKLSDPQGWLSEGLFWCGGSVCPRITAVIIKRNLSLCYLGDAWPASPPFCQSQRDLSF